jgi:hypothetical protein
MGSNFELIADMKSFINARGGKYKEWYVGACTNPRTTLFETRKVRKNSDAWIYLVADSAIAAKEVVSHFIEVLGTQGNAEDLPTNSHVVYIYKRTKTTSP